MHFSVFMLFASVYASTSFGGTLEIVDFDGQCAVWSNNNHGCTGHSAPFAKLDGDDCSQLNETINGNRQDRSWLDVYACGTENGVPAALIELKQTGLVTFANQNGDESACTLNQGLKVGSWCTPSDSASPSNSSSPPISPTTSSTPDPSSTSFLMASTCGCLPG